MNAPPNLPSQKRVIILSAIALAITAAFLGSKPTPLQRVIAKTGQEIKLLGITSGTIHWNPELSPFERILCEFRMKSSFGWTIRSLIRTNIGLKVVNTPEPAEVVWFQITSGSLGSRFLFARAFDKDGMELGFFQLGSDRSGTRTVRLLPSEISEVRRVTTISLSESDMPAIPSRSPFTVRILLDEELGTFNLEHR